MTSANLTVPARMADDGVSHVLEDTATASTGVPHEDPCSYDDTHNLLDGQKVVSVGPCHELTLRCSSPSLDSLLFAQGYSSEFGWAHRLWCRGSGGRELGGGQDTRGLGGK